MGAWTPFRAGPSGPLVGRERESAVILDAIERCARTGIGGTIIVAAEAGMGKTRLLEAAGPAARAAGFAWTWTESVSYGRGEPYRWARLLAQTVADEQGVDSGTLARRFLFQPDDGRRPPPGASAGPSRPSPAMRRSPAGRTRRRTC